MRVSAAVRAASTSPRTSLTSGSGASCTMKSKMSSLSGPMGAAFQSGRRRPSAAAATSGSACSTATRPSSSTTWTPSMAAAAEVSTPASVAP